jgi:acyl dehydratase
MIDYDKLMKWRFPEIRHKLTRRDTILYALGVGLGGDPMDEWQLRFVLEDRLVALPTMATVLAYPGFWIKDPATGVDWVRVLHGEQAITLHRPLPVEGELMARSQVVRVLDKGRGKSAIIHSEREISDAATGALCATVAQTTVCRGQGGFGGPDGPGLTLAMPPPRPPDVTRDLPTAPGQALLYRLCGDDNPLHSDPRVAREAGYPRPILHGLCTLGVVGHALLAACCGYDASRVKSLRARFSAPVYPGETIRTAMWRNGTEILFQASAVERAVSVLDRGLLTLAG